MDTPPPRDVNAQGLSDQQFGEILEQVEDPTSSLLDPDDFKPNHQESRSSSRVGWWFNRIKEMASRRLPARSNPFWDKAAKAAQRYAVRLAGREALATVTVPGPANLAVGAYETYRFGKEGVHATSISPFYTWISFAGDTRKRKKVIRLLSLKLHQNIR